jgi:hypothetical protein
MVSNAIVSREVDSPADLLFFVVSFCRNATCETCGNAGTGSSVGLRVRNSVVAPNIAKAKYEGLMRNPIAFSCSVIAAASGDGLIHEIINGLAVRSDAKLALRIPVVQIPTGEYGLFYGRLYSLL